MKKIESIKFISNLPADIPRIISGIAYQKKDKRRASIFIANEFAFGVNVATIEKFRLRKGDEISHDLLKELREFDERISAKRAAMKFLNTRRRTRKEVIQKLKKDAYLPEVIEEVIAELKEVNLIDDEEFSRAYIHDKRLAKPVSSLQLAMELKRKGVGKDIIEKILLESDSERSEDDRALSAGEKKWEILSRREPDNERRIQKLSAFLGSRGFNYDVVKATVKKLSGSVEAELAE